MSPGVSDSLALVPHAAPVPAKPGDGGAPCLRCRAQAGAALKRALPRTCGPHPAPSPWFAAWPQGRPVCELPWPWGHWPSGSTVSSHKHVGKGGGPHAEQVWGREAVWPGEGQHGCYYGKSWALGSWGPGCQSWLLALQLGALCMRKKPGLLLSGGSTGPCPTDRWD